MIFFKNWTVLELNNIKEFQPFPYHWDYVIIKDWEKWEVCTHIDNISWMWTRENKDYENSIDEYNNTVSIIMKCNNNKYFKKTRIISSTNLFLIVECYYNNHQDDITYIPLQDILYYSKK